MTEYPPILSGTALEQIAALRDYLVRRAREDDSALASPSGGSGAAQAVPEGAALSAAALASPSGGSGNPGADRGAAALRALVVKTADTVQRQVDLLAHSLHEDYLARSDFGAYQEQIDLAIRMTARQIVESTDYASRLTAADRRLGELASAMTDLRGEIRRGLIADPETGELCFGIAVAESLRFTGQTVTQDGVRYEVLAPGQTLGLYTASGWQFWCGGSKRGWFDSADGQLHVRSLTAEQELRLGADWVLTPTGGFGVRYVGQ